MLIPGDLLPIAQQKTPCPEGRDPLRFLQDSGVAVGPSLDLGRHMCGALGSSLFKLRANREDVEKRQLI